MSVILQEGEITSRYSGALLESVARDARFLMSVGYSEETIDVIGAFVLAHGSNVVRRLNRNPRISRWMRFVNWLGKS